VERADAVCAGLRLVDAAMSAGSGAENTIASTNGVFYKRNRDFLSSRIDRRHASALRFAWDFRVASKSGPIPGKGDDARIPCPRAELRVSVKNETMTSNFFVDLSFTSVIM
jgi:hypothetical protein